MGNASSSSVLLDNGPSRTSSNLSMRNNEVKDGQFEDAEDDVPEYIVSNGLTTNCLPHGRKQSRPSFDEKNLSLAEECKLSPSGSPSGSSIIENEADDEQPASFARERAATVSSSEIECTDVLLGRGGQSNHHPGNIFFRRLVRLKQGDYLSAKKSEKGIVACDIVKLIRGLTPPGRFLKKASKEDGEVFFVEVGDTKARDKASQALREGAPELREELREEHDDDGDSNPQKNQARQDGIGPQNPMASLGMMGQSPFFPLFPSFPFVPGGQSPLVPPGHQMGPQVGPQMGPQMVQTPYGPAMLPIMTNSQMHGLHFPAMMAAQQAMLQAKQGLVPGEMAHAAAAAAGNLGAVPWLHDQQQLNSNHILMQQAAMMASKRQREDTEDEKKGRSGSRQKVQKTS